MYDLKLPKAEDLADLLRMALEFVKESPYKDYDVDLPKVSELVYSLVQEDKSCVVILTHAGKNVGMIAGTITEFLFNRNRHAGEIVWWVDPQHRRTKHSLRLKAAFEYWAKEKGCKTVGMSSLNTPKINKYYEKEGYRLLETGYVKEL